MWVCRSRPQVLTSFIIPTTHHPTKSSKAESTSSNNIRNSNKKNVEKKHIIKKKNDFLIFSHHVKHEISTKNIKEELIKMNYFAHDSTVWQSARGLVQEFVLFWCFSTRIFDKNIKLKKISSVTPFAVKIVSKSGTQSSF